MKVVVFCHSLVSDWNHGNAHFLRGIVGELQAREHDVRVFEPAGGWSRANLIRSRGPEAVEAFAQRFPHLTSETYGDDLDLDAALGDADVVIVHEWNEPELVARIGRHHSTHPTYTLFFHDTHHRAATAPAEMGRFDLSGYDGVLAFGKVIRDIYIDRGWARRAWVWHEAADVRVFRPLDDVDPTRDLVWVGNWDDEERTKEIEEFLLGPARALDLEGTIHGVRYPETAIEAVTEAGLEYRRWVANYEVPDVFARHRATVHVPRRPYTSRLPGIPTIRVFEALACGIPLVCAQWDDVENLFTPGRDYLVARDGAEMTSRLKEVLTDEGLAEALRASGLRTIAARHTCAHRVDELSQILEEVG